MLLSFLSLLRMACDLSDKISAFSQISLLRIGKILTSIGGSKDLIIDVGLMKPLERFIGVKALRSHGVDKIFKLDKETSGGCGNLVFLIRSDLITAKRVCDKINTFSSNQTISVIAFPSIFHSIRVLFEEEGLYEKVTLYSFHWELISLDTRLFSFESPEVFKSSFVAKDGTHTMSCARTLWSLQHILGKPQLKFCIGTYSKTINSMMTLLDDHLGAPDVTDSEVGLLLIVDRSVDYVSTLLTPGTYTSLLDDVIGVNCGMVQVPSPDGKGGPPGTLLLSKEDETYNQIRHKHFSDAVGYLNQKINSFYSEQARRNNMSVQEMLNFVRNDLSKVASSGKVLSNHLNLSEKITDKIGKIFEGLQNCQSNILVGSSRKEVISFIEELIATSEDSHLVLRLICLLALCQNGLTEHEANSLKLQFLHAYGYEHLSTLYNLEKMGLISTAPVIDAPVKLASKVVQAVTMPRKGESFQITAAKLKLFPEASDTYSLKNPQDLGYVFGGIYIPLIVQIVSSIIKKEKNIRELLKWLPSEFADAVVEGNNSNLPVDITPNCVWVYVVGGVTYAEVAAFDLLEKKTGCRIICSGSSIINGNAVIQSAMS